MKNPKDRELESFSPEVLAEFIRDNVPMLSKARTDKMFADLIYIEARQRIEKINKEIDLLIAKARSLHGVEHVKEYLAVQNRITALDKQRDEAADIAYPRP